MFGERLVGAVRRAQGDLRSRRPDEPRQGRPPAPGWTSTCGSAATGRRGTGRLVLRTIPTTAAPSSKPPTGASGVGKCRQHEHEGGTVMCPSYQVTDEEEHSTRGRARLLFEMLNGHGDSPVRRLEIRRRSSDALDLCLACKGCKTDCPANVDMATYKAEFLAQHYRRPAAAAVRLCARLAACRARLISTVRLAGSAQRAHCRRRWLPGGRVRWPDSSRREHPCSRARRCSSGGADAGGERRQDRHQRRAGDRAALAGHIHQLLPPAHRPGGSAGARSGRLGGRHPRRAAVLRPDLDLDWSARTGKTDTRRTVARLAEHVRDGGHVVGLEPSCTTVFRSDAAELFPDDRDVHRLRDHTLTLAELLTATRRDGSRRGWTAKCSPRCTATSTPCSAGTPTRSCSRPPERDVSALQSGCCGLAGNFGFQPGHGGREQGTCRARPTAAGAGRGRGNRRAGGRLQLPDPDPRARQRRSRSDAPGRATRLRRQLPTEYPERLAASRPTARRKRRAS